MAKYKVEDIRNVALVGHRAVGKTTLADAMLFKAGAADRFGKVDDKTSLSDFDPEERERQFSIESSVLHLEWKGKQIHLLDTPGYPDFIAQCVGALRAAETAVIVVGASGGIELNTRRTFDEAGKAGTARILVINHLDAENLDFAALVASLRGTFGNQCVPLNLPIGLGGEFRGVVDLLDLPEPLPGGVVLDASAIHQQLVDAIVESDEALMERYLEEEELSGEEVAAALGNAIATGTLVPILCTCAEKEIGVDSLLDLLAKAAPSPADVPRVAVKGGGKAEQAEDLPLAATENSPLLAQVFKTRIDPFVAKLSYLRIYSGTLKKDATVTIARTGKNVRVGQLLRIQGGQQEPVDEAIPGDIVAVVKVEELGIGDTVSIGGNGAVLPPIQFPTPMVGLAVTPKSRGDEQKISGSLAKIAEEDPAFRVTRDRQTKELVITGMSELHLTILQSRLRQRDKLEVETHIPKIPYRETVTALAEASYRHKKQSGGRGQFAEVHLRVCPLPRDLDDVESFFTKERFNSMRNHSYDPDWNFGFVDSIVGGSIPNQFIPAVEKGVRERMEQGVLAGNQVQDVVVEVFFGKDHPVDSSEQAFKTAGRNAFREAFNKAKPVLLEPIVNAEIVVPAEKLGDITSDLNGRRGRVGGMEPLGGGLQLIRAQIPLAEMSTYARALSSITAGQGSYTIAPSHYDIVPPNVQQQVVAQARKGAEEDD